ncbi:indole-3-glycerol phosphate synthase TrpC [Marinicella meishanensis]|uniref:indole-3-glycerol phosphate synthase TrpC n=1 Tax=Marinicella meishanensis TaxID=2873263 RepID=UPI001CC0028D|nr:indole-3-glycerol phosphate synthase TrpC [Marinicella sp. NBU2979]
MSAAQSAAKGNVLDRIVATKREEVAAGKQQQTLADLAALIAQQEPPRGFAQALESRLQSGQMAVIAEAKKASPSKGVIRADFDPVAIARSYQRGGAACLSVLTDEQYFQGHDDYLRAVKQAVSLPILRKDFMIDPWQIHQSRAMGADCVLLIVACLDDDTLHELYQLALELGMDVLMEVHDEAELQRAMQTQCRLLGINNRNLKTFDTSLETSARLRQIIGQTANFPHTVISESGIHTSVDVQFLQGHDIGAFLIGESLMRHADPGDGLKRLLSDQA